jgi:predicted permease
MRIRESRFGRLVGQFFAGFLNNDLLTSAGAGIENTLSQAMALIVTPGLFYCVFALFWKYGSTPDRLHEVLAWEDRLLFVHFAMILTGILTIIQWDSLFPDRRDYEILAPLPLPMRVVFFAKVCSVLLLLVIFWGAANLGPALLFPPAALTAADPWFALPRHLAAHLISTFMASAFVFLFLTGLHGLLLNVLTPKWFRRVSVYVQLAAVVGLVLSFLALPLLLSQAIPWIRTGNGAIYVLPPFWFMGLYQVLIGRTGPVFSALAATAILALGMAAAVSALAYFASYQRHWKRSLESLETGPSDPGLLARWLEAAVNRFVLRHPLQRAQFAFIRATVLRSRLHRLLLAAYVAVGFALALVVVAAAGGRAASGWPTPGLLSVQLVLSFFLLSGIRFVFTMPAALAANWAFQAAEPPDQIECGAGVRKAMLAFGVCPVLAALLPLHALLWGWPVAAAHLLYGAALSALLVEVLLLGFEKIPFTCSYLPGKANVKALWPVYLMLFGVYAYGSAKLEYGLLARPGSLVIFCLAAVAGTAGLRRYSRRKHGTGFHFVFEDLPEPAVRTLDISYSAARAGLVPETESTVGQPASCPEPSQTRETDVPHYSEWVLRTADEFRGDFRYALRTLMHSPGFTLVAAAILALAIGANTLLFTFFSALVLKPLPITNRERNVELTAMDAGHHRHDSWSYTDFVQFRAQNRVFEEMYGWSPVELSVREPAPQKMKGVLVSGNFFRIFNAPIPLGRPFGPEEDKVPGRDAVVVLSYHAWRNLFNSDPQVAGKTMRIGQTVFSILGVSDGAFTGADPFTVPDVWAPISMRDQLVPQGSRLADPENAFLRVAGLLKPGLSPTQAQDSMFGTIAGLNPQHPAPRAITRVALERRAMYIPLAGKTLLVVVCTFALFGLVLLIACANLAGILLARGAARQRDITIRAAVGASRGRLIRQLLTESVLLCGLAAVPSLLLTRASSDALQRYLYTLLIQEGYHLPPLSPDWRVFVFAVAVALGAGVLLGLAPALEGTRTDLAAGLKHPGAGTCPNSRPRRIREWLVVGQVAASLVLLVSAGIFVRNAQRMHRIDPGFDVDHVIEIRTDGSKPRLMQKLKEDPRFEAGSEVYRTPLRGRLFPVWVNVNGRVWPLSYNYVESEYFETLQIPVRRGRIFTPEEARAQARVAVVSEATARLLWQREDPVGKTFGVSPPNPGDRFSGGNYQVIGVVPDVIGGVLYLGKDFSSAIHLPAIAGDPRNGSLVVRSRDVSPAAIAGIRKLCAGTEGVYGCDPVMLREFVWKQRFPHVAASNISSAMGALALALTCIGLYGVVAFAVVQRTREIGVRMALGARPASVLGSILTQTIRRVVLGIAIGIPVCIALSKIMAAAVFAPKTVETFDAAAYIAAPLFLAAVTLAAAYVPARRAIKIDPIAALRQE